MKVLVINCGSSSLKFQLIDSETEKVLAKGLCERIGIDGRLTYSPAGGDKHVFEDPLPNHTVAVDSVLKKQYNDHPNTINSRSETPIPLIDVASMIERVK